jgi:hypothetical protein
MKLYVASSWRNARQPEVVARLREAGHEVYDFRNPAPGNTGFMKWADAFVLVHPSGRSAHLEAGWAAGAGKPVVCLLEQGGEPELMVKLFEERGGGLFVDLEELVAALDEIEVHVLGRRGGDAERAIAARGGL